MKRYHKLLPTSNMVGVMARSIFMLRHKASSPYDFNIQFPMYTKFITHVYDVTLNTPMRQYCVTSMAPSTGHRNSVKHPIYMTFMFFPPYHTLQDDMQLKGEHTLWQRHRRSIMKTNLTTNLFEGLFTCSVFTILFLLQCTLFNTGRSRPPNDKGPTSSFQPWTHRPICSHSHSATGWT